MIANKAGPYPSLYENIRELSLKLIAIDVDGTLLDSRLQLREEVRKAIKDVMNKDLLVALVSGRPRCGVLELLEQLNLNAPDITSGGAFIYDPHRDHVIAYTTLQPETTRSVVEIARRSGAAIFLGSPERIFYEADPVILDHTPSVARAYLHHTDDILRDSDLRPGKITLVGEPDVLRKSEDALRALQQPPNLTYSGATFLEINHPNVSKGSALKRLEGYLNIPLDAVLAVGDSQNDISMFNVVGYAVAMGNSHEGVAKHADFVAPSNDEEGLAWVLRQIIIAS